MAVVIDTNTNEYTFILDSNVNNYEKDAFELIEATKVTEIYVYDLNNNKIDITNVFNTMNTNEYFVFMSTYNGEYININMFAEMLIYKSEETTTIATKVLQANTWYAVTEINDNTPTFTPIKAFTLKLDNALTTEELNNINSIIPPYIGNLTEIPTDKEPITQLRPFLTNIANAIRTKKGTTDTINAQNFASEIESIEGGGGGATLKSGWVGTAVPVDSTTTIENIYLNTNLSKEEVAALIQNNISLYPTTSSGEGEIAIAYSENDVIGCIIASGVYAVANFSNGAYYFIYDSTGQGTDIAEAGFSGWNSDFDGVIAFNSTNALLVDENYGSQQGNEALKSLFSITPFTNANIELSGEYTGETLTITENGVTNVIDDIAYEKKIITNIGVAIPNPIQTLVTGKGTYGGYYLCQYYKGDNVDFLADIDFSATRNMQYMFYQCTNLATIPLLKIRYILDMSYMFDGCTSLTTIPQIDTSFVTNMQNMFDGCTSLTTIPQIDTSNVTNMRYMFYDCSKLTTIPQLDTSRVTSMVYMFSNCSNLTTIPQLDTSNVTNISYMFHGCYNLTSIPQLDTSKVTDMQNTFYSCAKLTTIDITKFNPSSASFGAYFAYNCNSLTKFIIRTIDTLPPFGTNMFYSCYHFDGTTNPTYNPDGLKDARIYVPDDKVDELKAAEGWVVYADIIVPLSTLVE